MNIPLALAFAVAAVRWKGDQVRSTVQPDLVGALLLGVALSASAVGLSREGGATMGGAGRVLFPGLAALCAVGLVLWERKAPAPLFAPSLVRRRPILGALAVQLCAGAAFMVPLVVVPLWGNTLLGRSAADAALLLARLTLAIPIGALVATRLSDRLGPSAATALGMGGVCLGLVLMTMWGLDANEDTMTPALLLAGFGFGLMLTPTNVVVIAAAGPVHASTGAALVQSARLLGMTLASAALAAYGLERFTTLVAGLSLADPEGYGVALRAAAHGVCSELFRAGVVLALAGVLPAMLLGNSSATGDDPP